MKNTLQPYPYYISQPNSLNLVLLHAPKIMEDKLHHIFATATKKNLADLVTIRIMNPGNSGNPFGTN